MAPTSASKKKSLAAAKKKVAAKRKTTKAQAKKKALSLSNRKKPPKPIAKLPSDWPVASHPPAFPPEASALRPGSLLRQTCSGNDIQMARSACVVPNFEKQKGKFLLIFPGNFSFGAEHKKTETEDTTKPISKTPATMGRIEGLRTNTPSFKVPFPHLEKSLVFPGKKVATTSKFLALSCSNKKSGTVQCKNIFSSAVVFGMPKWESSKDDGTMISTPISTAKSAVVSPSTKSQDVKSEAMDETETTEETIDTKSAFLHYGGSERTVDGATRSSRKSLSSSNNTNDANTEEKVPIWSNHTNNNNNDDSKEPSNAFDFSNKPPVNTAAEPAKSYDTSSEDDELVLSDTSDGDYGGDASGSATRTRLPPRRQASMTKKKYVEVEAEPSSEDTDDDDKSDSNNKPPAKKLLSKRKAETTTKSSSKKPPQKRNGGKATNDKSKKEAPSENDDDELDCNRKQPGKKVSSKKKAKTTTKASSKKPPPKRNGGKANDKIAKKNKEAIVLDDDDDSSSYASETLHDDEEQSSERSAPRRTSRGKANYKEESDNEDDIIEDSEKENESEDQEKTKPKPQDKRPSKSKTPSSKRKAAPSRSKSATTTPKSAKRARTASTGTKKKNAGTETKKAKIVSVLERSSAPSPGTKSPFRRRHKKKSPAKKSRAQQVLDLTQDDEFTFG